MVALSVLAAVVYGILHDQITARICVEYFTIGHARLIDSDSPTVLGLFWGVVATWWVGLPLSVPTGPFIKARHAVPGSCRCLSPSYRDGSCWETVRSMGRAALAAAAGAA